MAKSGITGDWAKLTSILNRVKKLAQGVFTRDALQAMANTSLALAKDGAAAGKNPQGRAWKKLKRGGVANRWMTGSLSKKTGILRFEVRSSKPYSRFHQSGARKAGLSGPLRPGQKRRKGEWRLPVRRVMPKTGKKLPAPWGDALKKAALKAWSGVMKP